MKIRPTYHDDRYQFIRIIDQIISIIALLLESAEFF